MPHRDWTRTGPRIWMWWRNWPRLIPFFDLSVGDTQSDLHHQRHRIGQHELAQDHQESRLVPERRGAAEIVLSGPAQHQQEMDDADPRLDGHLEPLYDPVRGATSSAVTHISVTQNSAHPHNRCSSFSSRRPCCCLPLRCWPLG